MSEEMELLEEVPAIKGRRILPLTGDYAAAYAVKAVNVDVVAAYPITPQTPIVERISKFIADGELSAEMIHVESEHSALSACVGASAVGARVFTATSAQGLELMYEIINIASGMRLPIVMAVVARALSAPVSIHGDYGDVMSMRDTGWIIMIASNAQEVYDFIIMAYKIAEDPNVLLPVAVAFDGFITSHVMEPVEIYDDEYVRKFVPKRKWPHALNPRRPVTMNATALPEWYYEIRYQVIDALNKSYNVINDVMSQFNKYFNRDYKILETYYMDDAEYAVITYGAMWGFAREAIDRARARGIKVGGINFNLLRPMPVDKVVDLLSNVKSFITIDKAFGYGAAAPLFTDISAVLKMHDINTPGISATHGVGQRTMFVKDFEKAIDMVVKVGNERRSLRQVVHLGLRGWGENP